MVVHVALLERPYSPSATLSILRLAAGGFLLLHGLSKLLGFFGGSGITAFATELRQFGLPSAAPLPLLLAALQTVPGLMVIADALTRIATLGSAAFLGVTVALNLSNGWFWIHGGNEYPVLRLLANLTVALTGPGALSFDATCAAYTENARGR